jgi:hypothetical protein
VSYSIGFKAMKRTSVLGATLLGVMVSINCSQGSAPRAFESTAGAAPVQAGSAGAPAVAGSSPTGTAGVPVTASGGSGDPGGSGGSSTTGGAPASGGSPTTGGGAGGNSSGGAPSSGGTTSAGAGGAPIGAGGAGISAATVVPDLQGYYWEGTCAGGITVEGHNCPMSDASASCPTNGINREKTIAVKGTKDQLYTINIEVRGVIGTRCYQGGKRASEAALNTDGTNNWWYIGGTYANATGWWNTYELHVSPSATKTSGEDVYYFNGSGVAGGNDCEREATYLVKYNASFQAKGGSNLTFKIHDQNCKGQQNCGSDPSPTSACSPRTVDLSGMAAMPPTGFSQPPANNSYKPQWMLIAVTSVTSP